MINHWRHRLKGGGDKPAPHQLSMTISSAIGCFIAISLVLLLGHITNQPFILGSLGASCLMLFGFPDLPFSQPRNAIFGHVVSSLIGLVCLYFFADSWWGMPLALSLAVILMITFGVVHPPAGSNPIIIFLSHPSWNFFLFPTFVGIFGLVVIALIYNNLTRKTPYPKYW